MSLSEVTESTAAMDATRVPQAVVKKSLQLDYVDGLRGFLTLSIVAAHIRTSLVYVPLHHINPLFLLTITTWIWPAFFTVGMFVAISGYCLMLPVARSKEGTFRGGVWDYLHRRSRRILPPYYAALLIYIVASFLIKNNPYWSYPIAMQPGSLLSHIFLVHNLFQNWRYSIDASSWTVGSEWELYLLFPFLLLPLWRRFGIPVLLVVSAILCAIPLFFGGDALNFHSWYIFIFAMGMCGAAIQHYDRPLEVKLRGIIPWRRTTFILLVAFVLMAVVDLQRHADLRWQVIPDWKRFLVYEIISGAACVTMMVHLGQVQRSPERQKSSLAMRFLTMRVLTFVGMYSYSHYLLHWPLLISTRWVTQLLKLPDPLVILTMYFGAPMVTLSVGYIFFLMVERWFLPSHLRQQNVGAGAVTAPIS